MFYRTDDPIADHYRYEQEQERSLARYPKCAICGERIPQADIVCIDGKYYCDECLDDCRVSTEGSDEEWY